MHFWGSEGYDTQNSQQTKTFYSPKPTENKFSEFITTIMSQRDFTPKKQNPWTWRWKQLQKPNYCWCTSLMWQHITANQKDSVQSWNFLKTGSCQREKYVISNDHKKRVRSAYSDGKLYCQVHLTLHLASFSVYTRAHEWGKGESETVSEDGNSWSSPSYTQSSYTLIHFNNNPCPHLQQHALPAACNQPANSFHSELGGGGGGGRRGPRGL